MLICSRSDHESFTASGGAFIFGILLGWSAPTASSIVKKDEDSYYFWVTENQFALIVALMALGAAIGSSLSGMIRSKLGTKITILLYGLPILIGWTLITFPMNPVMVSWSCAQFFNFEIMLKLKIHKRIQVKCVTHFLSEKLRKSKKKKFFTNSTKFLNVELSSSSRRNNFVT